MKKILVLMAIILSFANIDIAFWEQSCFIDWNFIQHWKTITAYESSVSSNCQSTSRTCNDWTLSWNSNYNSLSCQEYNNNELPNSNNIDIWQSTSSNSTSNNFLDQLWNNWDIKVWNEWEKSIVRFLYNIAKDLKTVIYIISWVYFMIITIKLILSNNTEEEVWNFKKWIIWITIGIILMQIVFFFVEILYAKEVWAQLAWTLAKNIIEPIIKILETAASFFFLLVAIYAFYRIVTANWDEEKVKSWKMSIIYAIIWFIVIKLSKDIVYAAYWRVNCNESSFLWVFQVNWNNCVTENQISGISQIIVQIINWANSFIWIIIILMIIYAWVQVLFSWGDEEKLTKAKKSIVYIAIWVAILVLNYFILTFFLRPEVSITI